MNGFSVGVVGAGAISQSVHLPVLACSSNVQIVWITDANADRTREVAETFGLEGTPLPDSPWDLPPCDAVLLAAALQQGFPEHPATVCQNPVIAAQLLTHVHQFPGSGHTLLLGSRERRISCPNP